VLDFEGGDGRDRAAFAKAAKVVKLRAYHTRVVGNPMEPRAAMGSYDPAQDMYFLHGTTQGVGPMRASSRRCSACRRQGAVVAEGRWAAVSACASTPTRSTARCSTRQEARPAGEMDRLALGSVSRRRTGARHHPFGELALDRDGRILGMRFDYLSNLGAYVVFTGAVVNTLGLVNVNCGVYDVQAVHVRGRLVLTNTVPTAAYRGAGRPVAPTRSSA
jgi:carbon-monoxide dehydrogenase large subunit